MSAAKHKATVARRRAHHGLVYRWECACGARGDWRKKRQRAVDGGAYHGYGNRAMTADEVLTGGDGMNAGLSRQEAAQRAAAANARRGWG